MITKLDEFGGFSCSKSTNPEEWHETGANAFTEPYGFTGKEYEKDLGITYFGARYYNPQTTRWLSPDPLYLILTAEEAEKGQNVFSYCRNNPLNIIDQTGLEDDDVNIKGLKTRMLKDPEIKGLVDNKIESNLIEAEKVLKLKGFRSNLYTLRFALALIATESTGDTNEISKYLVTYKKVAIGTKMINGKKVTKYRSYKAKFRGLTQIRFGEVANTLKNATKTEKAFIDKLVLKLYGINGFSTKSSSSQVKLTKNKKMLLNRKFNIAIFNIRMRAHATVITNTVTHAYVHKYGSKDGLAKAKVFLSKKTNMMILLAVAHNGGNVVKKVIRNIVSNPNNVKNIENHPEKWVQWGGRSEWKTYVRRINSFMTLLQ